jgi:hypothetical protein
VTHRNHGQGAISFAYLDDLDANAVRSSGHLEPLG